ncbi:type II toxin-antitoxin system VapC family toxin [Verminephrobacter aporrectodeae]|uniref:Ribonuclease VapC n=1 Tax=Verminephrobacter aporrectodeae subsp. tuberculatae TaxID=1110392 RepID=A0ABT3KZX7_9BURK|nr:type II toxin-antitoxin system VapC family toxin [Verminephrobacter aporrectodeae]MCW5219716.1 type II toxin-antitoxin system VapC family toxin [Verminephrobacter aporrectodeae subsp. tuberculatae]MCW5258583.1 type II toxin-antitoxin system VapC family toxin [Verminephrobacter aporrectodeae subsp. tuberculatae]MCW5287586.1 type II toxin-antitoxin system VapC family toxin [Verminephrobacter aporrectodeae subsp. tuberculatae]MCW5323479.1 type II toxin-antitoxin system VapC family toxin [Vermin
MPRFMLDTNMCIYLMKNQPEQVAKRFAQCYVGDVVISAITYAELEYGVSVSASRARERRNLDALIGDIPVVSFDATAAVAYGPIREATRERKKDHLDKLIAAHSVALDVVLVTNNERDFVDYPGIKLENWTSPTAC